MKKNNILILFILHSFFLYSQVKEEFIKIEDSLKVLGKIILNGENDFVKYNANEKFLTLLESALITDKSFEYPFDSLKTIALLTSSDNKFRIFNWNLRKADFTYEYFGFIQAWDKKQKKRIIFPMKDNSEKIEKPETQALDNLNWYGAHYYKLILNKSGGKKYYTLLGWDGNDKITQKKIIDVLYFNSKDKPVFGAPIFKYNKKTYRRIIFEYSATTSMSLKFEKQYMLHGKKKRKMIVFDRLSPLDPQLTGQYQFYFPETNLFDAFLFKYGKWTLIKDVDARMAKESKADKLRRKKIKQQQKEHGK